MSALMAIMRRWGNGVMRLGHDPLHGLVGMVMLDFFFPPGISDNHRIRIDLRFKRQQQLSFRFRNGLARICPPSSRSPTVARRVDTGTDILCSAAAPASP